MPARLSLAGQCPSVAACVALRLRAVRRRHPATRRPSGRAAWRRPDTGQCVRERRRSERDALLDALVRHRWKPMAAARELGISRATLYRRVRRHGIRMPGQADD
ncbi:hypothetical protein NMC42_09360 [Pseudomonas aeruginosa]